MLNAFIIVWRESLEALLVIGVLLAWIARQPETSALRRGLWLGTIAGIALAALLGYVTFALQSQFSEESLEIFQLCMVLFTAALIVQMVFWMYRHGRHMKRQLEQQAENASGSWGIGTIAMLAVAREGAETVIFLYGLTLEAAGSELLRLSAGALAGFVLAIFTGWAIVRSSRFINTRMLFITSGFLLLLVAQSMLANGIDRLIAMEWLPPLLDPAWDISSLLDDRSGIGHILADFVGYRSRPTGLLLLASLVFWCGITWRVRRINQSSPAVREVAP